MVIHHWTFGWFSGALLGFIFHFFNCLFRSLFESEGSTIVETINEMTHLSQQMFFNNLSFHGSRIAEKV